MLNITTALGRNGFQDWLLQRVSALILALYTLFLLTFWLFNPHAPQVVWINLFGLAAMQLATIIALLALLVHAWIGMWVIFTDYLQNAGVRLAALITVYCFLLFYFIWGIQILWG